MKTREERERELQRMNPEDLDRLYRKLHRIPEGMMPTPGTLLIEGILNKEFTPPASAQTPAG